MINILLDIAFDVLSWSQVFILAYTIVTLMSNLLEVCMGPWITVTEWVPTCNNHGATQ